MASRDRSARPGKGGDSDAGRLSEDSPATARKRAPAAPQRGTSGASPTPRPAKGRAAAEPARDATAKPAAAQAKPVKPAAKTVKAGPPGPAAKPAAKARQPRPVSKPVEAAPPEPGSAAPPPAAVPGPDAPPRAAVPGADPAPGPTPGPRRPPAVVARGAAALAAIPAAAARVPSAIAATPAAARTLPGRAWRGVLSLRDPRRAALVVAFALVVAGVVTWGVQLATPPGGGPLDIREIPGSVGALIDTVNPLGPRQESGYPRIKIDRVGVDLLIVRGDGGINPPVKYEAFTYPTADHLLVPNPGGGNSYVYAHARVGMFWNLHYLHIGDRITVDYGKGKTLEYRVSEIHTSVDWRDLEWTLPTADDRLTLQTCNGWRDQDPRFIVVALRIPSQTALAP